jgi:hypothetical protein
MQSAGFERPLLLRARRSPRTDLRRLCHAPTAINSTRFAILPGYVRKKSSLPARS